MFYKITVAGARPKSLRARKSDAPLLSSPRAHTRGDQNWRARILRKVNNIQERGHFATVSHPSPAQKMRSHRASDCDHEYTYKAAAAVYAPPLQLSVCTIHPLPPTDSSLPSVHVKNLLCIVQITISRLTENENWLTVRACSRNVHVSMYVYKVANRVPRRLRGSI